jgi:hypothetical protein
MYGKIIMLAAAGSFFARHLTSLSIYFFVAIFLLMIGFILPTTLSYLKGGKRHFWTYFIGMLGLYTFALFFGTQIPIPFRSYIFVIGIALTLPGLFDLFKGGKK